MEDPCENEGSRRRGVQSVIALEGTENHSNKTLLVIHIGFVTIMSWQFRYHRNNEGIH